MRGLPSKPKRQYRNSRSSSPLSFHLEDTTVSSLIVTEEGVVHELLATGGGSGLTCQCGGWNYSVLLDWPSPMPSYRERLKIVTEQIQQLREAYKQHSGCDLEDLINQRPQENRGEPSKEQAPCEQSSERENYTQPPTNQKP